MKDTQHAIRPQAWQIVLGMIAFAAPWLWLLERSTLAPPTDNIEQLTWVRSLEWGYYKHPPLPTWLLWPFFVQALGWSAWTTYVLGALCTLGGFFIYWRMLRGMRGGAYALVALLAGLCVTFYNGRLHFYNHEIPLITFVAGAATACWRAWQTRKIVWWVALGLCLGLGALSKYQAAVAALCVFVFWLSQRGWRDPMQVFGLRWRRSPRWRSSSRTCTGSSSTTSNRWAMRCRPRWARTCPGRAFAQVGRWWGDQILNRALPAWALLAALWLVTRRLRPAAPGRRPMSRRCGARPAARVRAGAAAVRQHDGPDLRRPRAAALGHALSAVRGAGGVGAGGRRRLDLAGAPRTALVAFLVVQAALMLRMALVAPTGGAIARKPDDWRYFDSRALAEALHAPAMRALADPSGSCPAARRGRRAGPAPAGAAPGADQGELRFSPWVPADLASRCGALELKRAPARPGVSSRWRPVPQPVLARQAPGRQWLRRLGPSCFVAAAVRGRSRAAAPRSRRERARRRPRRARASA